jgi:hypothetical protein
MGIVVVSVSPSHEEPPFGKVSVLCVGMLSLLVTDDHIAGSEVYLLPGDICPVMSHCPCTCQPSALEVICCLGCQ